MCFILTGICVGHEKVDARVLNLREMGIGLCMKTIDPYVMGLQICSVQWYLVKYLLD